MKVFDILGMGIRNLLRRKTRTFLTVIGVVVGAAAIIIMISFGIGMNENLQKSIENMGDLTIIDVQEWAWRPDNNNEYINATNVLDEALLEKIKSWDGVLGATPYFNVWNFTMQIGKKYSPEWADATAIDASFLPYMKIELESGYMPQPGDENWIIFGARRARWIRDMNKKMRQKDWDAYYNPDMTKPPAVNILAEKIYLQVRSDDWWQNPSTGNWEPKPLKGIKKHNINSIGLIKYTGDPENSKWDEHEYQVYIDYKIAIEILKEYEKLMKVKAKDSRVGKFNQIRIKVKNIKTSELIQQKLTDEGIMLNWGLADMRDEMQKTQSTMQMILGGIGAMSLLVAAIGIANTMFMSIYERTKEIGVMKVLGCPLSGIQSMFLFEASIIGFCGGLLGSGISLIGSYLMNNYEPFKKALGNMSGSGGYYYGGNAEVGDISVIPLWLIILAVIFATIIGLVSGYLPARRATKISALEAIRNE
jgi:ABC-type antimicrobial peptide transport system permease subunit